ncbi:hypothetical protein F8271_06560 [Micromonospora sp. ALFpr18c]|uniref:hypothetical protein n=1 Tax=Micromonospora sp. ALFpr18c TaxID=1458665 RepID=UPI00124BA5F7|nr:hypothetical protein [Micromonospora sp. ALFpr18c]KAB1946493.1 hypothetical protein F8271_06560 [Micromonospora sp. ALFpr18c]
MTKPVTAGRAALVDDLEGLPGSSGGCRLALTLDAPVFLRTGDDNGPRPASLLVGGRVCTWWRVKDSNLRSFRDGFTERT